MIKLYDVSELLSVKDRKTSFPRKQPQTFDPVRDVTEGLSMRS